MMRTGLKLMETDLARVDISLRRPYSEGVQITRWFNRPRVIQGVRVAVWTTLKAGGFFPEGFLWKKPPYIPRARERVGV